MKICCRTFALICLALVLSVPFVCAQPPSHLLKLPAHTFTWKVSWWDSIYRFPEFQDSKIIFATGFSPEEKIKLNYNLYFGSMDLITEKGDTVKLKIPKELKLINIGGHIFYCEDQTRFIEILVQTPVALGVWNILNTESMVYVSGNIEASGGRDLRGAPSVYDRYYKRLAIYFFIDEKNKLHKTIKPSILKLFPDHKEKINVYLQENKIDFNKEEDLVQLVNFCSTLDQH